MTLPVAILAGGFGIRLGSLTQEIPKSLINVAGKPFIVHQLELLRKYGFTKVVLCVGYLGERIQATLGDGSLWSMHLEYVFDFIPAAGATPKLMGTGGAIKHALPLLGDEFLVLYGDTYLLCDYDAVVSAFQRSGKLGLMTVFRNVNQLDRSNVFFSGSEILLYDKRRPVPCMQHIDYGLGVLHAQVFGNYPEKQPFDLADVYRDLIKRDELAGYEVMQRFYEIGSPSGLEETRKFLSNYA